MTATLDVPRPLPSATKTPVAGSWWKQPRWNRFTPLQLVVLTLATIAPLIISFSIGAALLGVISVESMITVALAAGEDPGMIVFGAMLLASPVQWVTGRSQVRVRKYLGIVFFLLAASNGAMFVVETGIAGVLSAPFLIAGTIAVVLATPLFLTSSRRAQRVMGMSGWRKLHKLTYVIAVALLGHVVLMGEVELGAVIIVIALIARIPAVRRWLQARSPRATG